MASSIDNAHVSPSPSPELESKLEAANLAFGHAKEAILSAYHQALSEGFSPFQAKELLFTKIKSVSQRTIYLYLPGEAKDKEKQGIAKRSLQSCELTQSTRKIKRRINKRQEIWKVGENQSLDKVILNSTLADVIHDNVSSDRTNGFPYSFVLKHDGQNVSSVEDYESEDVLTPSTSMISINRDESDSKSKDVHLWSGHSEVKPEDNEINLQRIECPDCKEYVLQIQELKEALKACSVPTTADTQLAARAQYRKEFEIPININEILRYIQSQKTDDFPPQILIVAYLDTETGEVFSVYLGEPHTEHRDQEGISLLMYQIRHRRMDHPNTWTMLYAVQNASEKKTWWYWGKNYLTREKKASLSRLLHVGTR